MAGEKVTMSLLSSLISAGVALATTAVFVGVWAGNLESKIIEKADGRYLPAPLGNVMITNAVNSSNRELSLLNEKLLDVNKQLERMSEKLSRIPMIEAKVESMTRDK